MLKLLVDNVLNLVTSIEFESIFYFHPNTKPSKKVPSRLTIKDAIRDTVDGQAKPLVAVVNGCHAVTFTGEEGHNYIFKNSYGKNNVRNPACIKIPKSRQPFNRLDLPNFELYISSSRIY